MFLVIKSFRSNGTSVKSKVTGNDIRHVDISKGDDFRDWDFEPSNADDFTKRKYYGQIPGDNMVLRYILYMSGKSLFFS